MKIYTYMCVCVPGRQESQARGSVDPWSGAPLRDVVSLS